MPINIGLASLGSLIGGTLVVYVWTQSKHMEQEQEKIVAEWERNRIIREEDESECVSFLDLRMA